MKLDQLNLDILNQFFRRAHQISGLYRHFCGQGLLYPVPFGLGSCSSSSSSCFLLRPGIDFSQAISTRPGRENDTFIGTTDQISSFISASYTIHGIHLPDCIYDRYIVSIHSIAGPELPSLPIHLFTSPVSSDSTIVCRTTFFPGIVPTPITSHFHPLRDQAERYVKLADCRCRYLGWGQYIYGNLALNVNHTLPCWENMINFDGHLDLNKNSINQVQAEY